ncbi:MAG: 30S ribosomal protein S6 [Alphaproteobacteria bacterium]|nr:MAG: 30S ribosomal protein S6 [Alphaproteobacteria bacterium]
MIRSYRSTCLLQPALSAEEAEVELNKVLDYIKHNGGEVLNVKSFGLVRTAYPIQKNSRSHLFVVDFSLDTKLINNISTNIVKVNSNILRYMHVQLDKESKSLTDINVSEKTRMKKEDMLEGNSAFLNDLTNFTGLTGKIQSRLANRFSAKQARLAARAIKRRRFVGLAPFKVRF